MDRLTRVGITFGVLASLICLFAGIWILYFVGFEATKDNAVSTVIGLYFIGKACFVGPMLVITALRMAKHRD